MSLEPTPDPVEPAPAHADQTQVPSEPIPASGQLTPAPFQPIRDGQHAAPV